MVRIGLSGLPGVEQLDDVRNELFKMSHNWDRYSQLGMGEQAACWMGHKILTAISIPANILEVGICTTGFVVAASTLGALKVAIFAATLGNVKPSFPTGCVWFGERTLHGMCDTIFNVGELMYDAGNVLYQGYRAARWVAGQLHLGDLFNAIFRQLGKVFEFVAERIEKGIRKASEVEVMPNFGAPYPLNVLDDWTAKHRIDFGSDNRSFEDIFKHYVLSVANMPLNVAVAIGSGGLAVVLSSLFTAKVLLYATTNVNIPIPTYAGQTVCTAFSTSGNVIKDAANNVADAFVLIYKVADILGVTRVVTTALRVVLYIPEALFG